MGGRGLSGILFLDILEGSSGDADSGEIPVVDPSVPLRSAQEDGGHSLRSAPDDRERFRTTVKGQDNRERFKMTMTGPDDKKMIKTVDYSKRNSIFVLNMQSDCESKQTYDRFS